MIKRIQLRGISRSPSDRLTDDGGVAESLNVQLDNTEVAPMVEPKDVTASLGLSVTSEASMIYIHKTANYENIIAVEPSKIVAYTALGSKDVIALAEGEEVYKIAAVGNSLAIATSVQMYYILYKDGKYISLGNTVPFPEIEVKTYQEQGDSTTINREWKDNEVIWKADYFPTEGEWNQDSKDGDHTKSSIIKFLDFVDNQFNIRPGEVYVNPIFVRYAIELYDGTLYSSAPILCGVGSDNPYKITLKIISTLEKEAHTDDEGDTWYNETETHRNEGSVTVPNYKIRATLKNINTLELWKDIIYKLHIYMSEEMAYPISPKSSTLDKREFNLSTRNEGVYTYETKTIDASISLRQKDKDAFFEYLLEKSGETRLVKTLQIKEQVTSGDTTSESDLLSKEIKNLASGEFWYSDLPFNKTDWALKDPLNGDDMKHYSKSASNVTSYNNQLILIQPVGMISYNLPMFNSLLHKYYSSSIMKTNVITYNITWLINRPTGKRSTKKTLSYTTATKTELSVFGFHVFPDARCYRMIVKAIKQTTSGNETRYGDFAMVAHPYLNCACYYGGMGTQLWDLCTADVVQEETYSSYDDSENKLYVSEFDNPFSFPAERIYTFQSPIKNVAIATTSLSQGQFGQFPLYVFTEDGIWAMETAADGSFVTSKPLSREVCINPDSITSLDNAVVFVTAKGVMLLQGSQVTNISPFMNGRHYTIESGAKNIIENQDFFCDLLPALSDQTHFLAFVKEATVAYDYSGQRLIFIKKDEKYQYIYKLDTQTWHKTAYDIDIVAPINSYPECLVQGKKDGKTRIYDLSTILDAAESKTPVRGVIATRPFDLGEPDVFKTITDVRIRGQFPKGAVKFILLGSNDGINFTTISTLRGRSWKLFRMIILADLAPTERISWVDIMYETKFTNKLR